MSALEAQLNRPPGGMPANPDQSQQPQVMGNPPWNRPTKKIWQGELSWKNPKSDSNQEQQAHSVVCTVSSQLNETQTEPIGKLLCYLSNFFASMNLVTDFPHFFEFSKLKMEHLEGVYHWKATFIENRFYFLFNFSFNSQHGKV